MFKLKKQFKYLILVTLCISIVFGFSFNRIYAQNHYWEGFFSLQEKKLIKKFASQHIRGELKGRKKSWKGIFGSLNIKREAIRGNVLVEGSIFTSKIQDLDSDLATKLPLSGGTMTGAIAWNNAQTFSAGKFTQTLAVAKGGTGLASLGSGSQYLRVNAGGTALEYNTLAKGDLGLGNVENTALSTWAGTTNITTLGTVATGTWNGTAIAEAYLDIFNAPSNNQILEWNAGAGKMRWIAPPGAGGESNTASNQGSGGVGVFYQKNGLDLQFKNINAGSSKITSANDAGNNEIDIDISEGNLTLDNIGGTLAVAKGGSGLTVLGSANQYLKANAGATDLEYYTLTKGDVGLGSVENTALSTWIGSNNLTTLGTITSGTWSATTVGVTKGGLGLTALGLANQSVRVNSGGSSLEYNSLAKSDMGLGSVENTALSTWVGTANITTLGTIATGTWNASNISIAKGGTGLTALGSSDQYLRVNSGVDSLEYHTLAKGDVGLGNVENTALSAWAGTANVTTLGTIGTGTWNADAIPASKLDFADSPSDEEIIQWNDTAGKMEWATQPAATSLPSGLCLMTLSETSCPSGWTMQTSFDDRTMYIVSSGPGDTGGAATHTHAAGTYVGPSHTHGSSFSLAVTANIYAWGGAGTSSASTTHTHTISGTLGAEGTGSVTGTSESTSTWEPYVEVIVCCKD